MESLLRWSIENSTPLDSTTSDRPPAVRSDLNPEIIDLLLGKPDAELMKEDLAVAVDSSRSEDDRVNALDHLEMLVEQIDNANNLAKMKMWEPLHSLLTSDTATHQIKVQVLWVIGTALQNNPSAQDAYFKTTNPLATLVSFLDPSSPSSTLQSRSKTIYTLSGLLKHNNPVVKALGHPDINGWARLRDSLQDPEITVRRKVTFLLNTLLLPTATAPSSTPSNLHTPSQPIHENSHAVHLHDPSRTSTSETALEAVRTHGIIDAIISALTSPLPYGEDGDMVDSDLDFEEKGVRLIHTYTVICGGELSQPEKDTLRAWLSTEKTKDGEASLLDRWNLGAGELVALADKLT